MSAVFSTTDMWRLHPGAFTLTLMRAAQGLGAELRLARLTGNIGRTAGSSVEGAEVGGSVVGRTLSSL
jgi:hypothetical protein